MADTYDYEGKGFLKPITFEFVKKSIIDSLKNFEDLDLSTPSAQEKIEDLAKQTMFHLWENLDYMDEDPDLEELADNLYEEQHPE